MEKLQKKVYIPFTPETELSIFCYNCFIILSTSALDVFLNHLIVSYRHHESLYLNSLEKIMMCKIDIISCNPQYIFKFYHLTQ